MSEITRGLDPADAIRRIKINNDSILMCARRFGVDVERLPKIHMILLNGEAMIAACELQLRIQARIDAQAIIRRVREKRP